MKKPFLSFFAVLILLQSFVAVGQYAIEQPVIGNGGGTGQGGSYSVSGTAGQSVAGTLVTNPPFMVHFGFWTFEPLIPTATTVSVSGRLLTADGRGISNARVTLMEADGNFRTTITGAFGYYRFEDVSVGQIVIITISSKRFQFIPNAQVLAVNEAMEDMNFTANP